jgi:hypothetical protein
MKSPFCLGILVLFFGQAHAATPPVGPGATDALQLVKLLHLDEMLSRISNQKAEQAFAAGRLTETQLTCVQATPADFTERLASVARAELTAAELSSALVYLRSNDGRKVEEIMAGGDSGSATPPDLTASEASAFAAFRESPAGKKLLETSLLMKTAGMKELANEYAAQVKSKCKLTQPLQPPDDPTHQHD